MWKHTAVAQVNGLVIVSSKEGSPQIKTNPLLTDFSETTDLFNRAIVCCEKAIKYQTTAVIIAAALI